MHITTNSIARWREEICRHLLTLDFEPASDSQFRGSLSALLNINGVRVTLIGHTPGHVHRDQRLAKDGTDTVALLIAAAGVVHVSHAGRESLLSAGQATLLRNWEPGVVALSSPVHYTAVLLPTSSLDRGDAIDSLVGQRLPRTAALNLIQSYVSSLRRPKAGAGELVEVASVHLIELARLALRTPAKRVEEGESESVGESRLRIALEMIDRRHCEPGLSVEDIAAAQGISPRYLQKLLERKDFSFSSRVNTLRLQTAYAALARVESSITEIALGSGFRDLSYFNRLFRRHFGETPSAVRAARGGGAPG
jgi:AraC-like DNA-binding protein